MMELNWSLLESKKNQLLTAYGVALESGATSGTVKFVDTDDSNDFVWGSIPILESKIDSLTSIITTLKTKSARSWAEHLVDLDANRDLLINNGVFNYASTSENGVSISRNSMMDFMNYRKEVVRLANKEAGSSRLKVYSFNIL